MDVLLLLDGVFYRQSFMPVWFYSVVQAFKFLVDLPSSIHYWQWDIEISSDCWIVSFLPSFCPFFCLFVLGGGGAVIRDTYLFLVEVLGIEHKTLCMLNLHFTTELFPPCSVSFCFMYFGALLLDVSILQLLYLPDGATLLSL